VILLEPLDLALGALLVLAAAALNHRLGTGLARTLLVAAARTTVQLLLVGLVLRTLFGYAHPALVALVALVMIAVAGREVHARQQRRLRGAWGLGLGAGSLFVSSFAVAVLALVVVVEAEPWYAPQYAIPLLGLLLGNTMTGVALGVDRLTQTAFDEREVIETRLALGEPWSAAVGDIRAAGIRSGLTPVVNAMAAAGIVHLPGIMTGQILAGVDPVEAVKYQILVMFLIAGGTVLGTAGAVWLASARLFDERERLRLDRLDEPR